MKKESVPKDKLSIDVGPTRHKWQLGKWERVITYFQRTDTCTLCGCKRHNLKYYSAKLRGLVTEVSGYSRSGVDMPAKPAPECWRDKNPK